MIQEIKNWNDSVGVTERITISVDLEKPRNSNLLLIPNVDFIFLGKDFARFLGFTSSKTAVRGFKKRYPGRSPFE